MMVGLLGVAEKHDDVSNMRLRIQFRSVGLFLFGYYPHGGHDPQQCFKRKSVAPVAFNQNASRYPPATLMATLCFYTPPRG